MATDNLEIANGALMRLGAKPISSLTEVSGRAQLCNQWINKVRKQTLRAYPWNCALERVLLDTFPNATLTPSAVTGDGVTFQASANVFEAGRDEHARIITANDEVARIQTVVAANEVTADIETDLASVAAIAAEGWRIAPSWEWSYRYLKPSDYLRVVKVEAVTNGGQTFMWSWWSRGQRDNSPEPVKIEGQTLVSQIGPTMLVQYTKDLTDTTKFDPLLDEAIESLLAFRICYGVTGSLQAAKTHHDAWKECLDEARTMDGQEGTSDDSGSDVLLAVRG